MEAWVQQLSLKMSKIVTPYGKLHYEVEGHSDQTIVFMIGVMASLNSWSTYVKQFVDLGYQVVTFDFIGQLLSDKPEGPYTFDQHVDEVSLLLDHLKVTKVHIIGTSYGSEVGMKFAMTYPKKVLSLSLIDGTAEITPSIKKEIDRWTELTYGPGDQFFWGMAPGIYHPDFIEKNREGLEKRAQRLVGAKEYLRGQRILYKTFLTEVNFLDELDKIECPTIVIVGEDDTLKTVNDSLNIHNGIKNSEMVIIPNCGHVAIFEKPDELSTLLIGFIEKMRL